MNLSQMSLSQKKLFILFSFILETTCLGNYNFLDITEYGYEQYQDIIINNTLIKPATNNHLDCDIRYQIIKRVLDKYQRPFTMLDIGASQGYYSFRTAHDYDAVCVMIEGNNPAYPMIGSQLFDLCKANNQLNNVILFNKAVTPQDLQHLSECEHFDVVLALNIIHWFDTRWKEVADAIINMGSDIIIETPPQEAIAEAKNNIIRKEIEDYLYAKKAKILGKVPRHTSNTMSTLYLVESNKQYLQRKTWLTSLLESNTHNIISTPQEKKLIKKVDWPSDTYQTSEWLPGINLLTFKMYQGDYPIKDIIKKSIEALKEIPHNDWSINNMILQGDNLAFIDLDDPTHDPGGPGGGRNYSQEVLDTHLTIIDIDEPIQVEHYFWYTLTQIPVRVRECEGIKFIKQFFGEGDLVFDIGAHTGEQTKIYLNNKAHIVCIEPQLEYYNILYEKFHNNKDVTIIQKGLTNKSINTTQKTAPILLTTLDELINTYGHPQFCKIRRVDGFEYEVLQGLSQPIPYISFRFDIHSVDETQRCIHYLASLGYKSFNFTARDIPLWAVKQWVPSKNIISKIYEFASKDYFGSSLSGDIYAQYE